MTKAAKCLLGVCLTVWVMAAASGTAYAGNGSLTIDYTVKVVSHMPPLYHVTCEVKGIKTPQVELSLPTYAPGLPTMGNYARNIQRFKVTDAEGKRLYTYLARKQTWRVETGGASHIKAEFDYVASKLGSESAKITPDFAYFTGFNLFLSVDGHRQNAATVRFETPPGWRIVSALNETKDPAVFTASDYEALVESPTLMGRPDQFRVTDFEVMGKRHSFVAMPAAKMNDEKNAAYVDTLKKIVATQGAIFGELPYDKYIFFYFFMPADAHPVLEYLNSHVAFIENDGGPTHHTTLNTAAHAFFHTWNFRRIRPADEWARDYSREPETSLYWVVEGISNYYTNQTKLRAGLQDREKFIEALREAVLTVELNEVRHYTSPADSSMSAWYRFESPGGAFPISVHQQGNVLGALLDLSIRHDTGGAASLDDVMRALYRDFYLKGKGYTTADLIAVINQITKRDYTDFFRRHVQGVEVPSYETILGYAGYTLEQVDQPVPALGFNLAGGPEGPVVTSIAPGSPAAESGLARGDLVLTIDELNVSRAGHGIPGLREWLTPRIGAIVDVVVKRNGVEKTLKMKVGSRPSRTLKISEVPNLTAEQLKIRNGWAPGGKETAAASR